MDSILAKAEKASKIVANVGFPVVVASIGLYALTVSIPRGFDQLAQAQVQGTMEQRRTNDRLDRMGEQLGRLLERAR